MARPLLSAALIVKNEERFLEQCLASIRPVVDEIVVVDTGSTDRTKQIAAAGGARLHTFPWQDDFAAARNESIRLCRGEWILYIDADERVRTPPTAAFREALADDSLIGLYILLHSRPGWTPYWEMRLFRNHPAVRFNGIIHENIWPGLRRLQAAHNGKYANSELVLDHVGYEGDQEWKHHRNLPLLLASVERDPNRIYNWCHLARVHEGLGEETKAESAWKNAIAAVRRKSHTHDGHSFPYMGLAESKFRQGQDPEPILDEGVQMFPNNLQLRWFQARVWMESDRHEQAAGVFEEIIRRGESQDYEMTIGYDQRLFRVLSYDSLATCYFRMKSYARSRDYFALAAQEEPDNLQYRVKVDLCTRLMASPNQG